MSKLYYNCCAGIYVYNRKSEVSCPFENSFSFSPLYVQFDGRTGIVPYGGGGELDQTFTYNGLVYWDYIFWLDPERGESEQVAEILEFVDSHVSTEWNEARLDIDSTEAECLPNEYMKLYH